MPSALGGSLVDRIGSARILVVGAGGIGCELLKNLLLTGFKHIHLVDLDVIELSNLNRQFLFRRGHIGQPKAQVAREATKLLAPNVDIVAYWADIKDTALFPLSYFQSFTLVLNALDNIDARRYVNNMCLSARVPLIESGTAGYLGQTSVIIGGQSECFECIPREVAPKTFPVCTIRTTPSSIIHCVIWAKDYLLPNLFGKIPTDEIYPKDENELIEEVVESLQKEMDAFKRLRALALEEDDQEGYEQAIIEKVFKEDIERLLELRDFWNNRTPPSPLTIDASSHLKNSPVDFKLKDQHTVWDLETWVFLFKSCVAKLKLQAFKADGGGKDLGKVQFDKDDEDVMDFVAAAANIRAHIFGIPMNSRFLIKTMAGNIIPAIATTNAIAAGMIVLQALNILDDKVKDCSTAFITYGVRRGTLFACEKLLPPNESCGVCQVDRVIAKVFPADCTLDKFLEELLAKYNLIRGKEYYKEQLIVTEGSRIIYDEDMMGNLVKTLSSLACGESKFLHIHLTDEAIPLLVAINGGSSGNCLAPPPPPIKEIEFDFFLLDDNVRIRRNLLLLLPPPTTTDEETDVSLEPPTKVPRLKEAAATTTTVEQVAKIKDITTDSMVILGKDSD